VCAAVYKYETGILTVTVGNGGRWRLAATTSPTPGHSAQRGCGVPLMRVLTDGLQIDTSEAARSRSYGPTCAEAGQYSTSIESRTRTACPTDHALGPLSTARADRAITASVVGSTHEARSSTTTSHTKPTHVDATVSHV
jgi:hypothetical protein